MTAYDLSGHIITAAPTFTFDSLIPKDPEPFMGLQCSKLRGKKRNVVKVGANKLHCNYCY